LVTVEKLNNLQTNNIPYNFSIDNSMENFFNYISKPLLPEDVDLWFKSNNMIPEKMELYSDLTHSLNLLILETYLGEMNMSNETKIKLTDGDNRNHFEWCWDKVIFNFGRENIIFEVRGSHFDYFESFFDETFYNQGNFNVKTSIGHFFTDLFNDRKTFTKSDLDMITTIYKVLDKHLKY
jgi:hypothetical protein